MVRSDPDKHGSARETDGDLGRTLAGAGAVPPPTAARRDPAETLDRTLAPATPAPTPASPRPPARDALALGETLAGLPAGEGAAAYGPSTRDPAPALDRTAPHLGPTGTMVRAGARQPTGELAQTMASIGGASSGTTRSGDLEAAIFTVPGQPGKIHRFAVLRLLGEGGMGVVYSAYDEELDRRVAIKLVRDAGGDGSFGRSRILREAQAMAKVSHPNVVQVYEVGEFAGQVFVAMEFVKGVTLTDWLAEERPWEEVRDMFLQAGRGLAAAHAQGLVHRDFKPDNVLVGADGRARVLDFGLARRETEAGVARPSDSFVARVGQSGDVLSTNLTLAGTIMGTPAYMSPEQHRGEPADARSDQFSFSVALFEALHRQHPFPGETYHELSDAVLGGHLRPPPAGSRVPEWLTRALVTGMATDPADRHPSMDTLLAELGQDTAPPIARSRWLWPAVTVITAALAVLFTLLLVGGKPSADEAAEIDRLVADARAAASRRHWVYPGPEDPRDTAYNRIVLLESMTGDAATAAQTQALALRIEFADSLLIQGNPLYDDVETRGLARDYYVQALVFDPENKVAATRAGVTLGQLADLRDRAGAGEFLESELVVGSVQQALAEPDEHVRSEKVAAALAADRGHTPASAKLQLARGLTKSSIISAEALDRALGGPEAAPDVVAVADPPPAPAATTAGDPPAGDDTGVADEPQETGPKSKDPKARDPKGPKDPKAKDPKDPKDPKAKPEGDEGDEGISDPVRSMELTREAEAARRRGALTEAEQLFNQALSLWNKNGAAMMGLSDIHFDRGNFDRAVKYAEKAVRAEGDNSDYRIRLGDALFKIFRYADAQKQYDKAAELGHPKAAERLARVRAKLGE